MTSLAESGEETAEYYQNLLRPIFANKKFLLAHGVSVSLASQSKQLRALGAARPFLIADSLGTGAQPENEDGELRLLNLEADDLIALQFRSARALQDLPVEIRRDIDVWDPTTAARWLDSNAMLEIPEIAGRKKYALRQPSWLELEDKTKIDRFWDEIGVTRAPSAIVPVERSKLRRASRKLDRGLGTLWAKDASRGVSAAADGLRWVQDAGSFESAFEWARDVATSIRVMPFLEGIPLSIHGIVFPNYVAVFRPVEMIVLRPRGGECLKYAGCATTFDPDQSDREVIRDTAKRVGVSLRTSVDYRGPFTVDGILTEDGFVPTELNPRAGAGILLLVGVSLELPLLPLCWAVTEGEQLNYRPQSLERYVLENADSNRRIMGRYWTKMHVAETTTYDLARDQHEFRVARPDERKVGQLHIGPSPVGGFMQLIMNPKVNVPKRSAAPEMIRALKLAGQILNVDQGSFDTAQSVR